jgi:hypothetical protein
VSRNSSGALGATPQRCHVLVPVSVPDRHVITVAMPSNALVEQIASTEKGWNLPLYGAHRTSGLDTVNSATEFSDLLATVWSPAMESLRKHKWDEMSISDRIQLRMSEIQRGLSKLSRRSSKEDVRFCFMHYAAMDAILSGLLQDAVRPATHSSDLGSAFPVDTDWSTDMYTYLEAENRFDTLISRLESTDLAENKSTFPGPGWADSSSTPPGYELFIHAIDHYDKLDGRAVTYVESYRAT